MHKSNLLLVIVFLTAALMVEAGDESNLAAADYNTFKNPPVKYRSIPFWSLNDDLDCDEIKRQLKEFKKGGFGGAYLHSRIGLLTEFLSEDWFVAMDAGVQACEDLGIEAWFYDEDKWPSGTAGGKVPLASEDYHSRTLFRLAKTDPMPPRSEIIAEDENWRYICYRIGMGNPWFNGTCWVDLLNPETVKTFIDFAYRPYVERYKKQLGKTAKGMFMDEPNVKPRREEVPYNKGAVSYSPIIRTDFKAQHGYDIFDKIESLFEEVGDWRKIRLDYFRTVSKRFEESFSKQIGEYCGENNLIWTGHFNAEESLNSVKTNIGNLMIHYRHMQQPGIDHLGLRIYDGLNTARSLSSVANQYGIKRRLTEMFGVSGQNMSIEDRKWIANWHTVLGINSFCPHLSLYSMKGCRKRDCPPTISPQQPYWSFNKPLEDYMARLSYFSTIGEYAPEVLVIHPLESEYIDHDVTSSKVDTTRNDKFWNVMEVLQASHRDYDLGDEQIISEIGSVDGDKIVVGKMSYKAVILPYMLTMRESTLELLEKFAEHDGVIFSIGYMPKFIDGSGDKEKLARLKKIALVIAVEDLAASLEKNVPASVKIEGDDVKYIWIHNRNIESGKLLQLTNINRFKTIEFDVMISGDNQNAVLWDPVDAKCYSLEAGSGGAIKLKLNPAQTLFVSSGDVSKKWPLVGQYSLPKDGQSLMKIAGPWKGCRKDLNAITLDFAKYSTDGGKTFSEAEPVLGIHERFTRNHYNGPLVLSYDVQIYELPGECDLVLEQPGMYKTIMVNGQEVEFGLDKFYIDFSFRTTPVAKLLKKGNNNILLTMDYVAPVEDSFDAKQRYGTEIESIYLTGEFGVTAVFSSKMADKSQRDSDGWLTKHGMNRFSGFGIVSEKTEFVGDLTTRGYPFYAGRFELTNSFDMIDLNKNKKYFLSFSDIQAIVIEVELNGKKLPAMAWSPWEIDVTGCIKKGKNEIEITLVNSLRNLLGPHHHKDGELTWESGASFAGQSVWGGSPDKEPWYDCRLKKTPYYWRDDYYHVPFGLMKEPVVIAR